MIVSFYQTELNIYSAKYTLAINTLVHNVYGRAQKTSVLSVKSSLKFF